MLLDYDDGDDDNQLDDVFNVVDNTCVPLISTQLHSLFLLVFSNNVTVLLITFVKAPYAMRLYASMMSIGLSVSVSVCLSPKCAHKDATFSNTLQSIALVFSDDKVLCGLFKEPTHYCTYKMQDGGHPPS